MLMASLATQAVGAANCMDDLSPLDGLVCTANDVRVVQYNKIAGPSTCQAGTLIDVTLQAVLLAGANDRYDVGLYIATDGGTGLTGSCHNDWLPPQLTTAAQSPRYAPFLNLEATVDPADTCGDIQQNDGNNYRNVNQAQERPLPASTHLPITIKCVDRNNDGIADSGTCASWDNQASNGGNKPSCTSQIQTLPNTKSKCRCEPVNINTITVDNTPLCRGLSLHSGAGVSPPLYGTSILNATYNSATNNYAVVINTTVGMFNGKGLIYNDGQFPVSTSCNGSAEECFPTQSPNPFNTGLLIPSASYGDFNLTGMTLTPGNAGGTITFGAGTYSYTGTKFGNHTGTYKVVPCAVPEPGSLALMLLPVVGLWAIRRRRSPNDTGSDTSAGDGGVSGSGLRQGA